MKKHTKPVVIIVECVSTSVNYIKDLQDQGYDPICLELRSINKQFPHAHAYTVFGARQPKVITDESTYAKTLKKVKALKPVLILPGADHGLKLATKLTHDLNLVGNKLSDLPMMKDKYLCQEALKAHGLRHIEGIRYSTWEKALEFFNKHDKKVVVKPIEGVSTIGVTVCDNVHRLKEAIDFAQHKGSAMVKNQPIIQEFIGGDEFVVNTCTCDGHTIVTSAYTYKKIVLPGSGPVYVNHTWVSPKAKFMQPIVKYALDVIKAINLKWGPCHAEFKVDKKGPVLIETNCRIPGGSMPGDYVTKVIGHHETDIALKAYLQPREFAKLPKMIMPIACGVVRMVLIKKPIYIIRSTINECFGRLPSYHSYSFGMFYDIRNMWLEKTVDYETSGGNIYLVNKSQKQMNEDLKYIANVEANHIDWMYKIDKKKKR